MSSFAARGPAEVEGSGVDVVHAELDGAAEHGDGRLAVADAAVRSGHQAHRAETEPVDFEGAELPGARRGGGVCRGHGSSFATRGDPGRVWQFAARQRTLDGVEKVTDVVVVRGEAELFERTKHLFAAATEVSCAARDLHTWSVAHPTAPEREQAVRATAVRKVYQPGVLLDPTLAGHLRFMTDHGARIRITEREINETILLDRRIAIVAGDRVGDVRSYTVVSSPELVQGIQSLFEAAWAGATDLESYQARFTELGAREILGQLAVELQGRDGGPRARRQPAHLPAPGGRADGDPRRVLAVPGRCPGPRSRPPVSPAAA